MTILLEMIKHLMGGKARTNRSARRAAIDLYEAIVKAARDPVLYTKGGVADSVDGRFDSVALHAFLLMDRMVGVSDWTPVGEALADRIVADMDQSLREMGIGDMSIGKKVKAAAQQLYGRFDVYWGAMRSDAPTESLKEALARNLFRGQEVSEQTLSGAVDYVFQQRDHLRTLPDVEILEGSLYFLDAAETGLSVERGHHDGA